MPLMATLGWWMAWPCAMIYILRREWEGREDLLQAPPLSCKSQGLE